MQELLQRDGLSIELLTKLSYKTKMGVSLKRNLHYFDPKAFLQELLEIRRWYDNQEELHNLALDYRIKSIQSAMAKFERYYPDHQARKVFDDLLGFRSLVDSYDDILLLSDVSDFRVADMSTGKANDDGYRGVHVYFQVDNHHYPIEIQYNTYYDRQLNNWLHKYLYKKAVSNSVGCKLRSMYENGEITTENEFKEALEHVLCSS